MPFSIHGKENAYSYIPYGMGWFLNRKGNGEISHAGLNPNFTSSIELRPKEERAEDVETFQSATDSLDQLATQGPGFPLPHSAQGGSEEMFLGFRDDIRRTLK